MKKNLLTSLMALTIALSLSSTVFAQAPSGDGNKPGPWKENAENGNENNNTTTGNGTHYIHNPDGTLTDPLTGLTTDPSKSDENNNSSSGGSGSDGGSSSSASGCDDPLTSGWETCVEDPLSDGGKTPVYETKEGVFTSAEAAYNDTQRDGKSSPSNNPKPSPKPEPDTEDEDDTPHSGDDVEDGLDDEGEEDTPHSGDDAWDGLDDEGDTHTD